MKEGEGVENETIHEEMINKDMRNNSKKTKTAFLKTRGKNMLRNLRAATKKPTYKLVKNA